MEDPNVLPKSLITTYGGWKKQPLCHATTLKKNIPNPLQWFFLQFMGNKKPRKYSESQTYTYLITVLPFLEGFPGSSEDKESSCNAGDRVHSSVGKMPWRRDGLSTPVFLGFPGGSDGKESSCNAGDLGSIPVLEESPGEGNGYPV